MLHINREWIYGEGESVKTFTLEELEYIRETMAMDSEEFSEFITGLNCDSYADQSSDILKEVYEAYSEIDEPEHRLGNCYERCMNDEDFLTCYTVYRLWNTHHTEEQAKEYWKQSCIETLEGLDD